jgi:hypothetical protein
MRDSRSIFITFAINQDHACFLVVNFGYVLWVAFSIPPGSLSLVKYPVYVTE